MKNYCVVNENQRLFLLSLGYPIRDRQVFMKHELTIKLSLFDSYAWHVKVDLMINLGIWGYP